MSPSLKLTHITGCNLGCSLFQLNVKNAFLHGDLKEELYMEKTSRFVAQGSSKMCGLSKAIYGLK